MYLFDICLCAKRDSIPTNWINDRVSFCKQQKTSSVFSAIIFQIILQNPIHYSDSLFILSNVLFGPHKDIRLFICCIASSFTFPRKRNIKKSSFLILR